jgi:hypothetical protein
VTLDAPCQVCGRHDDARVCERCRHRMAEQLALLPLWSQRLCYALVPATGTAAERVQSTPGEAPLPARLAALTLVAAGTDDARCIFVPVVRVWATVEQVPAAAADGVTRSVPQWHREAVHDERGHLVLTPVDDQVGVLPVHEWLRTWANEWRARLGDQPASNPLLDIDSRYAPFPDWLLHGDPVAIEWRRRFGANTWPYQARRHHDYLTGWLSHACGRHPHIGEFAVSLRSLAGAIQAALCETNDLEYLGRCPEEIHDRDAETTTVCGAALWHDPYASVITCPRCHTETGPQERIWLARRILDAWPIDRRRRYPRTLIDALRPMLCATCRTPVSVEWLLATERYDEQPFWRPGTIACPNGCEMVE